MESPKTLQQAIQYFSDAENCREFMVAMRWPDGVPRCPYCDATKLMWMRNAKQYRCYGKHPKQKFSLKVGTVFEDSPISLEKWLPAVWLLANAKNGISSYEVSRALGVTQKTAWFMLHRIREAMANGSVVKMGGKRGGGPVEVDECYVGANPAKMHAARRAKLHLGERRTHKTAVMGMLDRNTRQVRATVIPNVSRETLMNEILTNINLGSKVFTDDLLSYRGLNVRNFVHETVTHVDEYVRGQVHTNGIENFWSLLKRTLKGTYVAVEPFHLDRYVREQCFRFNNRATKDNPLNDTDRFMLALSQVAGKRLTYAALTGKEGETAAV